MSKADVKKAISDASTALNDLNFFMGTFAIDVRNIAKDIQAYDSVDLADMERRGKDLKDKSQTALRKYGELYQALQARYGKDAA